METWPGGHIYENCLTNFKVSDVWVQLWYQHDKWDHHKNNMAKKLWATVALSADCDLCPASESIHHIVLRCRAASVLCHRLLLAPLACRSTNLISFVQQAASQLEFKRKWNVAFAACAITLWHARNDRIFNSRSWTDSCIRFNAADLLRLWCHRATKQQDKDDLMFWGNLLAG